MIILTIRTDKPEAELGIYEDNQELVGLVWEAHRTLTDTIHSKIKELLESQNISWDEIEAIVVFKGPGSFTGLRIGMSVANALAYSLSAPIVSQDSDDWVATGIARILEGKDEKIAVPNYGAEPNITKPKK